jgi:hypothetical protein
MESRVLSREEQNKIDKRQKAVRASPITRLKLRPENFLLCSVRNTRGSK